MAYQATIYQGQVVRWPLPAILRETEDQPITYAITPRGYGAVVQSRLQLCRVCGHAAGRHYENLDGAWCEGTLFGGECHCDGRDARAPWERDDDRPDCFGGAR